MTTGYDELLRMMKVRREGRALLRKLGSEERPKRQKVVHVKPKTRGTAAEEEEEKEPPREAFDVLMQTARQRPELMSLLPIDSSKDGPEWDEGALPVELPHPDYGGLDRAKYRVRQRIDELRGEFRRGCLDIDEYLVERCERKANPAHAARRRTEVATALVLRRCGLPRELLGSVNAYLAPAPMPPPATEPSAEAYLCEIRVHFSTHRFDDGKDRVKGLVLGYSDGTMTSTGDLRGTECPAPFILALNEHFVGVREVTDEYNYSLCNYNSRVGDQVTSSLEFFTKRHGSYFSTWVSTHDFVSRDTGSTDGWATENFPPEEPLAVAAGGDQVLHSLSWCPDTHVVNGWSTRATPPYRSYYAERNRVAGFSPSSYDLEWDWCWRSLTKYCGGEDIISRNLIPAQLRKEVHNLCPREILDTLKEKFGEWMHAFEAKMEGVLYRSNEAHNVVALAKIINKTGDKRRKRKLQKELKRQYKALDKRLQVILMRMDDLDEFSAWYSRYETCHALARKDSSMLSKQLSTLTHRPGIPAKARRLTVSSATSQFVIITCIIQKNTKPYAAIRYLVDVDIAQLR